MSVPLPRVLLVDDEEMLLLGLSRVLRKEFEVTTALGGAKALDLLSGTPEPFAAIVSDMRMPEMDGAEFLSRARAAAPDSVRMLLTGHADVDAALLAVNQGQIFRFLTKPCDRETLSASLNQAVEHHRLIKSERELLEKTLVGSIDALLEVLGLACPSAFGRAGRIRRIARKLATEMRLANPWAIETAAMLSQIGWVTLPPDTAERLARGAPLSEVEQGMVQRLPRVTEQLLAHIPRLEPVREILRTQTVTFDEAQWGSSWPEGSRVLKLAVAFEELNSRAVAFDQALATLRAQKGVHDPDALLALGKVRASVVAGEGARGVTLLQLVPGMVLTEDLLSGPGELLITKGFEITFGLLARLRNFKLSVGIREPIMVAERAE